jgi:predicted amidohydrolase YtcJ
VRNRGLDSIFGSCTHTRSLTVVPYVVEIRMKRALYALVAAVGLSLPSPAGAQEADLILVGGRIWTGDEARPWAEAVAIRDGRFLAVGGTGEVEGHRTGATRVVDLGGRFVTPGFIDNHTHFNQAGGLLLGINLLDVAEAGLLTQRVREARGRLPQGAWIVGGDWGAYEAWEQGSTGQAQPARGRRQRGPFVPDRSMIDAETPTTGVLLSKWDRSQHLANGFALERAGLSCEQPVEGLVCERGRATGIVGGEALRRVRAVVPEKSFEQRVQEAKLALAHLNELGVTGIHDITPREQFPVYHHLKENGELTVRVYARPTLDKWDALAWIGLPHGFGDDMLKIGGLKGFVDGIQGNSTARFYEPQLHSGLRGDWRDSTNTAATRGPGSGMEPAGNMERNLLGADRAGLWPQIHAIGDEAIDTLLTLMEHTMRENGPRERRFRIIHSQVIRGPEVAQRYRRSGIIAEVQPYHAIDDMRWMEERIGERSRWAYAFKTFHDAGVMLSFGSDWPGTNAAWYTASPLVGIYAAVTRMTVDGKPEGGWFPEERIDLETALRAYTVNNAYAAGEERAKGRIRPGMLADLAVIDQDLFALRPEQIKDAKVQMTVVGGRVVFQAPGVFQ